MLIEALSMPLLYDFGKFVLGIAGAVIAVYKVVQRVRDDVNEMKTGIATLHGSLENQTQVLANELREQRQDFRTFYAPLLTMTNPTAPRARAKRTPKKTK